VHEFEQFIDNGLQELPMGLEEPRVLSNDVHYIGRDYGFVILSTLDLAKTQKVLDNGHEETFLRFFICECTNISAGNTMNGDIPYSLHQI
jgi:hypothetical protein